MKHILFIVIFSASLVEPIGLAGQPVELGGRSDPAFSPDGKLIACKLGNSLAVMNRGGTNKRPINHLVWDASPSWSPDGKTIVFQSYGFSPRNKWAIWIVNSDGTNPHELTQLPPDRDQYPRWSLDGRRIAWTHAKQLWVADTSGQDARPLTTQGAGAYGFMGDWSPDSKTIVYLRDDVSSTIYDVWLINADGSNQRRFPVNIRARSIRWSRQSCYIFYNNASMLFKIKPDGTDEQTVCSFGTAEEVENFDISPDERFVVFDIGGPNVKGKIFLLKLPHGK